MTSAGSRRSLPVRGVSWRGTTAAARQIAAGRLGASPGAQRTPTEGNPTGTVTRDGTKIFYKDWGAARPVVFSHGWPLTADAWDDQLFLVASNGYRAIAGRPLLTSAQKAPPGVPEQEALSPSAPVPGYRELLTNRRNTVRGIDPTPPEPPDCTVEGSLGAAVPPAAGDSVAAPVSPCWCPSSQVAVAGWP